MRTKLLSSLGIAAAMAFAVGSAAHASTNIIENGGFELSSYSQNHQFGTGFGLQGVTGWSGGSGLQEWFIGGTQTTTTAITQWYPQDQKNYFWPSVNTLSPNGGDFVALDGDPKAGGSISQTLTNLEVGKAYTLTFDWAAGQLRNRSGDITEQLQVTFGDETKSTGTLAVASRGFSGWDTVTMVFTPTAATQTLTFLSIGSPSGLPPMALLDGVSLSVPEPATWAMMLIGFGGIGAMIRRRGRSLAAA